VRRLVWGVFDEDDVLQDTFRVCEDGRQAGVDDGGFTLPAEGRVGLVHPLHLADAARAGWSRLLADYRIIQPFPQLGRAVARPTPSEAGESVLRRWAGRQAAVGSLLGLERRGWTKVTARKKHSIEQAVVAYEKVLPRWRVRLPFQPPFDLGANQGTGVLGDLSFHPVAADLGIPLGEVPGVVFSEVVGDIDGLKVK
jgi:hypothetical protein